MTEMLVFDIEQAMARVDHDLGLYKELVQIFEEEFTGLSLRLTKAADGCNSKELESVAHSLKSALGNIGAMSASEIAARMEKMGRAGSCDGSVMMARALHEEVSKFLFEYRNYIAAH